MSVLGCTDSYSVKIMWRANATVFMVPQLDQITSIKWERVLNDTSTAEIEISVQGAGAECCGQLGQITEWCHELWIYRDGQCVWQGPVVTVVAGRDTVTVTAHDVTAWLARLANYQTLTYGNWGPTSIVWDIITRNLRSALSVPADYPNMIDYMVVEGTDVRMNYRKGKWIEYVLTIMDDLTQYGFQYTTVGRSLYLRDIKSATDLTQARLTSADLLGDVKVTRNGLGARTHGFATTQQQNQETGQWEGKAYLAVLLGTPYGRLDGIANFTDEDATTAQLRAAALSVRGNRYPAPVSIDVTNNAQLSPTAPVTVDMLVPGETFDVALDDFCLPVQQSFRLTEVGGEWTTGGEKLTASFSSLSITADDELGG
jgi:hypothetical protein